ncbi:MAG: TonB-dependent receptor [Deltaproteobacteria bacterium]|nr:TonB-dependent receptor [Candidatus Anaeroferrophillus wilburensis]MBN2888996.1 TonB-dependent receptor [Deltaproteobacteria bacterium]
MTVITAEQLQRLGVRDLRDVWPLIPGMQEGIATAGYSQLTFRGVRSRGAERLKILIDGHDVNLALTGGGAFFYSDLAVDYIQKIEVLRGPGSTLYGSDALLGVVNIITNRTVATDGLTTSVRFGTEDLQRYNVELKNSFDKLSCWGNINYFRTHGGEVKVESDILSSSPVNGDVSRAPGPSSEWVNRTDLSFGLETGNWRLQGQYLHHSDGGFFNPGKSLSDQTTLTRDYFWSDLNYSNSFNDDLLFLQAKLFYNGYNHDFDVNLQPPGFQDVNGVYPDGIYSDQNARVDEGGGELQLDVHAWAGHLTTIGGELRKSYLHDAEHHANYDPTPLAEKQDVSDRFNWISEADRFFCSIFLQDQWDITPKVSMTLGGRLDYYDDFGNAFSPSIGMVYAPQPEWRLKLSYSEAFRAPSFRELYKLDGGNPSMGNPDLDAEEVDSWQASLEWHPGCCFSAQLSGYWNYFDHMIDLFYDDITGLAQFENSCKCRNWGLDLDVRYQLPGLLSKVSCFTTISYIDHKKSNGDDVPGVAQWLGSAGFDWALDRFCNLNMSFFFRDRIEAVEGITLEDVDAYWLTNLAVTVHDLRGLVPGLDLVLSVHNLFDVDYAYPDITWRLSDHFARPGISGELWAKYRF